MEEKEQTTVQLHLLKMNLMQCRFDTNDNLACLCRTCENEFRNSIPELLGITKKELTYMLRSDQKLKSFGFVDEDGDYNSSLNECIESQSIEPYFSDLLKTLDCSNAYDLDTYSVKQESLEICSDLLNGNKPVSILFYGKPGSGKTELAKSLCKQTGKQVYIFKNEAETNERCNVLGRLVCLLSMERNDSILIVDEADTLLKTMDFSFFGMAPSKTKGTVNKMLEKYFPAYHLSNREIEILEDSESVTPGDFGALANRIRFMNQEEVNSQFILDELKKLQSEKKKQWREEGNSGSGKIGFIA